MKSVSYYKNNKVNYCKIVREEVRKKEAKSFNIRVRSSNKKSFFFRRTILRVYIRSYEGINRISRVGLSNPVDRRKLRRRHSKCISRIKRISRLIKELGMSLVMKADGRKKGNRISCFQIDTRRKRIKKGNKR